MASRSRSRAGWVGAGHPLKSESLGLEVTCCWATVPPEAADTANVSGVFVDIVF